MKRGTRTPQEEGPAPHEQVPAEPQPDGKEHETPSLTVGDGAEHVADRGPALRDEGQSLPGEHETEDDTPPHASDHHRPLLSLPSHEAIVPRSSRSALAPLHPRAGVAGHAATRPLSTPTARVVARRAAGRVAAMEHTNLGRTGLLVSRVCLGTMTFGLQCDEPTSRSILDAAAERGVTFLDAADVYPLGGGLDTVGRTEEIVGRWLEGRRGEFVVATKCIGRMGRQAWDQGMSRKHVLDAIDASLTRLRTDYVDLYQLHSYDPTTPLDEALDALDSVVPAGKARY